MIKEKCSELAFSQFLLESRLIQIPQSSGDDMYQMDIIQDEFVHFTPKERVQEILAARKLMMRPPYEKFGTDAVNAISLVYGEYTPGVQLTHIEGEAGAIWFKTNKIPYRGFTEEVIWHEDVNFTQASEISKEDAIARIQRSPESIDEMASVIYQSHADFQKMHKALVKSWGW